MKPISEFPPHARVWVYQADRKLTEAEIAKASKVLMAFVADWKAHGTPLRAGFEIRYGRFVILAVDEGPQMATGCSIDASVGIVRKLENDLGIGLLNRMNVAYRQGNEIITCSLAEFEEKVKSGEVNENTLVFNNMVNTIEQLKTQWETPVNQSWHSRYLQTA